MDLLTRYFGPIKQAMVVFPLIAGFFTLPYLLHEYRKYGAILFLRTLMAYSFILYMMCAYFLIILPLPPVEEVAEYTSPWLQLKPFNELLDVFRELKDDLADHASIKQILKNSALFQIIFNILLTVPFGVYLRYFFKASRKQTVILSLALSLFYELTQLSGWYGTSTAAAQLQITDEGVLTLTGMEGTFTYREDGSFRDESDSVLLKLVQEDNGETYLYQKSYASIPGLTTLCVASYAMERLPSYQPDEATQAAWEAREGKMYVQTNERWSSAYYALSGVFAAVTLQGSPEGYLLTNQLTAPDTAAPVLQIPGTGSRDSAVIRVLDVDGCETLELNGSLYQDASSVSPIFSGPESWCIIRPGQTARWYRTGEAAGSQMTVEVPENGGFYVYDAALGLQASSWLYGDTTVVLPENGWIVFSGEEGVQFHIYLSQP